LTVNSMCSGQTWFLCTRSWHSFAGTSLVYSCLAPDWGEITCASSTLVHLALFGQIYLPSLFEL
jgi:hypothetical protein